MHINKNILSTLVVSATLVAQSAAHGGIYFYDVNGVPSLGYSAATITAWPDRVARANWNWNVGQGAVSASSPSWSTTPVAGDILSFKVLTSLQKWNGTEFVDSIYDARILYTGAGNFVTNPTGATNGFGITMANSTTDYWHIRYNLEGVAQDNTDANGIYRLNFQASRTFMASNSTVTYPEFAILFNRGADQATSDAAFTYAKANVVPEPATITAMALGLAALLRRKQSA